MKETTKATKFIEAKANGGLVKTWGLMSRPQKAYARHLASDFGYPVDLAIQQSYIFGYDTFQYDYRKGEPVQETLPRSSFGWR